MRARDAIMIILYAFDLSPIPSEFARAYMPASFCWVFSASHPLSAIFSISLYGLMLILLSIFTLLVALLLFNEIIDAIDKNKTFLRIGFYCTQSTDSDNLPYNLRSVSKPTFSLSPIIDTFKPSIVLDIVIDLKPMKASSLIKKTTPSILGNI